LTSINEISLLNEIFARSASIKWSDKMEFDKTIQF
jgi:hypothetical protein